ncbi:MAG: integration host factor subunit alpha [bacterium]
MTKEDIIKSVWERLVNRNFNESKEIYEEIFSIIKNTLSKGEDIQIRGFGAFKVREKSTKIGRNPKTGEEAVIKERRVVTFRPSKEFKQKVTDGA